MLTLTLKPGEQVRIGDVLVEVPHNGKRCTLRFDAPKGVSIRHIAPKLQRALQRIDTAARVRRLNQ